MALLTMFQKILIKIGGLPEGETPEFYKDIALSLVASLATLVLIVLIANGRFTGVFASAALLLLVTVFSATKRMFVLAAVAGIVAMRATVAFILAPSVAALALGVGAAVLAIILVKSAGHDTYGPN